MERKILAIIQGIIAYEWLSGGFEKLKEGGKFAEDFAKTIGFFASNNPYPAYKSFLLDTVLPAKGVFAVLIPWAELLAGLVLVVGAVVLFTQKKVKAVDYLVAAALIGLIFMNLNFWFAAGWTGPSTAGLNLVVGLIEAVLLVYWVNGILRKKA